MLCKDQSAITPRSRCKQLTTKGSYDALLQHKQHRSLAEPHQSREKVGERGAVDLDLVIQRSPPATMPQSPLIDLILPVYNLEHLAVR